MDKKGENATLMYTVKVGETTVFREGIPAAQSARLDELELEMKQRYPTASREITEVGASSDVIRPRRASRRDMWAEMEIFQKLFSGYGPRNGPRTF